MTDPFIPHGMAGVHQELQRLRNENRQLRLELTKLKMQRHGLCRNCQGEITPTVSTPTAGPTSWQSGAKDAPDQRREASSRATGRGQQNVAESSASSAATASRAALHRIQSEMEQAHKARAAAEAQVQKTRAELKSLSAHFELFINEVAEREEAYRVVHCGIYDELEESKQQSELLRQQLCEGQERMAQLERSAATAAAASVAVAMGNYSPAVHASEGKAYCIAPEQKTKRSVQRSALPAARSRSDSTHRQGRAASRVKDTAMPHSRLLDSSEVSTVDNVGMRAIDSLLKEELSKESTFMTPHTSGEANEQDTAGVDGATGVSKGVTQTQPNMIHSYSPIGSDKNATSATTTTTTAGAVSNAHDRLRLNVFDIPPPRTVTGAVPKTSLHIVKGAGALRSNRTHGGGGARTTTLAKRRRRDDDAYSTSYEKEKSAVAPETPLHTADSRAANIAAATMNHPDSSDAVERTVCCVPNTAAVTKNTDMTDLAGSSCDAHAAHLARVSPPNKDGTAVRACKHTAVRKRESAETGKVATESCRSLSGNSSTHSTSHPSRCATDSRRRTGSRRAASSVNSDQGHPYSLPASSLFARFQSAQQSAASPSASMQNDASGTERTSVAPNRATGAILVSEPSSSRAMGAATWAVNWSAHIHFGADPIADFLTLADSTHVSAHRDKLRRELMLHCRTVTRVAAYATRYFMHTVRVHARVLLSGDKSIAVGQTPKTCATTAESSAESATPVTGVTAIESTAVGATMISLLELWQRVRHIIDVDQTTMYHALCISLTRQLVKLVQSRRSSDCRLDDLSLARPFVNDPAGKEQGGTDSAAVLALSRIRTLALALRFTWVHGVALHLTRYTSHSGMTRRQQQQHHPKFDGHADIVSSVQDRLSQTTIELAVSMLRGRHAAHHTHDMHSPRLRAEGTNSAGAESSCHSGCSNPDSVTDSCMLSHCGAGASEPEDSADRMRPRTPRVASASKMCVVSGSDALLGQRWMTAMYALCGFDAEVHSLMQYLNLTAAAQACVLTRSLSHFAVQGIFCRMLGASPVVCAETDEDGTSGMAAMCCPGEAPVCEESHLIDHSVNSKHTTRTDHITCTSPIEGDAHGRSADTYSNKSSFTCNGESNEKRNGCSANSMAGCNEMWCDLCASLQWSAHAIPLNAVGQAAVRILTRVGVVDTHTSCPAPDRLDALLALRLLVLYRGVDYLHNLRAQLSPLQRTVHVDADTIFAELCSFAVLDFGMCDVRYAPGQQMAAFLDDYLHAGRNETDLPTCINTTNTQDDGDESSESANNTSSNRVMQSRDKNRAGRQASDSASVASATRILVLRALVQLCQDTRSEDSLTYLARAMRWMRQSASAVTPTREVVDSLRDTALHGALHSSHVQEKTSLLRRTLIGKQLLRLVE